MSHKPVEPGKIFFGKKNDSAVAQLSYITICFFAQWIILDYLTI
jgi:hypothetical protein